MDDDRIEDSPGFLEAYRSPCGCRCEKELKGTLDRIGAVEAESDQRDQRLAEIESRLSLLEKEKAPKDKYVQG